MASIEETQPLPAVRQKTNVGDRLELCETDDIEESAPPSPVVVRDPSPEA